MSGVKQHTIPQFLLRGFESSPGKNGSRVWFYPRNGTPREDLTSNVAFRRHFYNDNGNTILDDLITDLEQTEYSQLVNRLRRVASSGSLNEPLLPEFAVHMLIRTEHLRNVFERAIAQAARDYMKRLTEPGVLAAALMNNPKVRATIHDELKRQGYAGDSATQLSTLLEPLLTEYATQRVEPSLPSLRDGMENGLSQLDATIKRAHIKAMTSDVRAVQHVDRYRSWNWFIHTQTGPLILGDSAVILETDSEEITFRTMPDNRYQVKRFWLPISKDRVVVASPNRKMPKLVARTLNKAIALCSFDFFVSSKQLPHDSAMVQRLGEWSGMFSQSEMERMVDDAISALVGKRTA